MAWRRQPRAALAVLLGLLAVCSADWGLRGAPSEHYEIDVEYPGLVRLNADPPVYYHRHFLNDAEVALAREMAELHLMERSKVGEGFAQENSRTSSTTFVDREETLPILYKVSALTGKPVEHMELLQLTKYNPGEFYLAHYDAFEFGSELRDNGGQRLVTVLMYLNDVAEGGATRFPELGLDVPPREGSVLVFFPGQLDGSVDRRALHEALPPVSGEKWVSQVWIRERDFYGAGSAHVSH